LNKARAAFQQALALETAGDWAAASNLFQQVAAVRLTPQVRFHLALCEEHLGNLSAALGDYQLAAEEARQVPVNEVIEQANARIEIVKSRIPKLLIRRGSGAESASISLDGVTLGAASIGSELSVNPGPHTIEAQARGYRPFSRTVDLGERDRKELDVTLQIVAPAAPSAEPRATATPPPVAGPVPRQPSPRSTLSDYVPFVLGGMGAASLITSGVFFGLRAGAMSTLDANCPTRTTCPPEMRGTYDRGRTYTLVADVTLGAGVVAIGTAAALFFTGRQHAEPSPGSIAVSPWPTGSGLTASTTW
jgi:hypothetical protein